MKTEQVCAACPGKQLLARATITFVQDACADSVSAQQSEMLMRCWAPKQLCRWTCWRCQLYPGVPSDRDTAATFAVVQVSLPRQCSRH